MRIKKAVVERKQRAAQLRKARLKRAVVKNAHKIKTAIVVDYMGSDFGNRTPEMEIKDHIERFSEFAEPVKLDVYTPHTTYPGELKPGTDLVLFDFGGVMYGNDLMANNSRHLLQWAADNPNSLVVIVSVFTYENCLKFEAMDLGLLGQLHNIVVDCNLDDKDPWYRGERYSPFPEWFEKAHGIPSKEYK